GIEVSMRRFVTAVVLFSLLFVHAHEAGAAQQSSTGTISGTITASSGAALPAAELAISGTTLIGGTTTVHVNRQGAYRATALPPGLYDLTATHADLQTT